MSTGIWFLVCIIGNRWTFWCFCLVLKMHFCPQVMNKSC